MLGLGIAGIDAIAGDYIGLIVGGRARDVALTALCSRNETHIREAAQRHGPQAAAFTDHDAMLRSGQVDAILICTPHAQYPEMTRQALEAGLYVLVGKLVGISADEMAEILPVLAERPELVCGVMYNWRAAQAYHYVKNLVQSGELRELVRCSWIITNLCRTEAYYTSGAWRGTWQGEGGGPLMTQASHQLDFMQWICGMSVFILARCSTIGQLIQVENETELSLTYFNGAHGHFIALAHECPGTNLLEICGTRGRISVRDDSEAEIIHLEENERTFARSCPSPFEQVSGTVERLAFDDRSNKTQQAVTI